MFPPADTISDREAHLPVSCLEKVGLQCLKSHFLDVERFGPAQVLGRQRRRNPERLHDGILGRVSRPAGNARRPPSRPSGEPTPLRLSRSLRVDERSRYIPTASRWSGPGRQRGCRDQPRRGPGLGGRAACGVRVAAVVVDGAVHGRAGLHHRQRGAAVDPAGPARRHDDAAVGDQRLRGGVRRVLATGWAARRRLRPGQAVPDRAGRIHPGEHLRRPGRRAGAADHFPGGAGDRRGYASARAPVPAGHQLAWGKGTRPRAGHLWRDRLGGLRVRRGARRPADRDHLAAGVLRQRPDRHRPAGRLDAAATPQIRPGTEAAWTFPAR